MTDPLIKNVSDTAFMVAAYRAAESERRKPLFVDPWAGKLAGDRGRKIIANLPSRTFLGGWTVIIRTCIIDDFILAGIAQGVDTVLNLGAGLDTRPYRMALPSSLRWIEVDYPHMMDFKEDCLRGEKPRCELQRIGLDLSDTPIRRKLFASISEGSAKILVLTEGVIPYLTEEAVASLANDLREIRRVRFWITDYFSPSSYAYRRRSGMADTMRNAPFLFEPKDCLAFFERLGWRKRDIKYLAVEARKLRRPPPFPLLTRLLMKLGRVLLPKDKRRSLSEYAGYVSLEPGPADHH